MSEKIVRLNEEALLSFVNMKNEKFRKIKKSA